MAHSFHDEIIYYFMAVGLTKFRSEEGFGLISNHGSVCESVFSMSEMVNVLNNSLISKCSFPFPAEKLRDWKSKMSVFKPLV